MLLQGGGWHTLRVFDALPALWWLLTCSLAVCSTLLAGLASFCFRPNSGRQSLKLLRCPAELRGAFSILGSSPSPYALNMPLCPPLTLERHARPRSMNSSLDDEDAIAPSGCDQATYRLPQAYTKVNNAVQASSRLRRRLDWSVVEMTSSLNSCELSPVSPDVVSLCRQLLLPLNEGHCAGTSHAVGCVHLLLAQLACKPCLQQPTTCL